MKSAVSEKVYQLIIKILIIVFSLSCLYPLLYVLALSFTNEKEWIEKSGFILWPEHATLRAYINIIIKTPVFLNSFKISILRVLIGTVVTLVFTLMMGYALSRKKLPGRNAILVFVLVSILFPGGLVPTYLVVKAMGLYNNFWVYIIPVMVDGWGVLVFKQFFEGLPQEVEESAGIDGANEFTMMVKILVPMSTAVIAAWGLFVAVGQWNAWFDALVYIRNEKLMPLQLIMYNLFQDNVGYNMNAGIVDPVNRVSVMSLRMAITVLGTVPILMVYPFLQKYFMTGVYVGAVKG
jgi:ABC-type sugar transport system, permease component